MADPHPPTGRPQEPRNTTTRSDSRAPTGIPWPSRPPNPAYGRFARWYGALADPFEGHARSVGLRLLDALPGETVLEIGHGTGRALVALAEAVGPIGRVTGLDRSEAMHRLAEARLRERGLLDRVQLEVADATDLPYPAGTFDAAFTSFTIETLPGSGADRAVAEAGRVLRPGGRLVLVAISDREDGVLGRLYRWVQARWPTVVDCRPIPVARLVADAGLELGDILRLSTWGIPVDAVVGRAPATAGSRPPDRPPQGATTVGRAVRVGLRVVDGR